MKGGHKFKLKRLKAKLLRKKIDIMHDQPWKDKF